MSGENEEILEPTLSGVGGKGWLTSFRMDLTGLLLDEDGDSRVPGTVGELPCVTPWVVSVTKPTFFEALEVLLMAWEGASEERDRLEDKPRLVGLLFKA